MPEPKCVWFSKGKCLKGLPGTKCEVVGCVARNEERLNYSLKEFQFFKINGGFDAMSKRAEQKSIEAFPDIPLPNLGKDIVARRGNLRRAYIQGYEQAEKDIISLIESRIAEIMGDAQPAPVLRIELQELIKRIKEEE